jgi:hypothetical protein
VILDEGSLVEDTVLKRRSEEQAHFEDDGWLEQQAILRRAAADLARRRAESAQLIAGNIKPHCESDLSGLINFLHEPSPEARNIAVRAFYDLNPDLAASLLNRALMQGSAEERRSIGAALVDSGLADQAVQTLTSQNQENCYGAFSLLFLVAKAGEVGPLLRVIADHPNIQLRIAVIKLLALSRGPKIATAFFDLVQRTSLPLEVRSAVREAIFQIGRETR